MPRKSALLKHLQVLYPVLHAGFCSMANRAGGRKKGDTPEPLKCGGVKYMCSNNLLGSPLAWRATI